MKTSHTLLAIIFIYFSFSAAKAQDTIILTYEQAVDIALKKSYTILSHDESRQASQYDYLYYKAQFKPRLDFNVSTPSWDEGLRGVDQVNDLPVYNSYSSMQFGGDLRFTYVLPTGGNLALSGTMYHETYKTSFLNELGDYETLKRKQAYSKFGIIFNQPIFTKNTLRENLKAAEYRYQQTEAYFTRAQMDIVYDVTVAFYRLYQADYERKINEERVRNSTEALRIARLKQETGNIPEGDVLITEINVAQNNARLSESVGLYETEKDAFKLLIGLELKHDVDIIAKTDFEPTAIDLEIAIDQALQNRMEIKENEYDIKLQNIQVDKAKREREFKGNVLAYYDLTGLGTDGSGVGDRFQSSFDDLTVRPPNRGITLTLSYPIYDWGRGRNIVKREKIRLKAEELKLENTKRTIEKEIREVVRTVYEAENRFRINQKNIESASRSYKINQLRFENGDITGQELALEQERLSQVQLDYISSYITYQLALADLKRKTMWDFENNRSYKIDNDLEK
ncbi:MAG: TolC family protein [Prevotellaceae bacterium]|jgi:outer membrane protein TolC|nr:TolC family protein [Prevotellaceae bacterium]